jgi:hypothetical protein
LCYGSILSFSELHHLLGRSRECRMAAIPAREDSPVHCGRVGDSARVLMMSALKTELGIDLCSFGATLLSEDGAIDVQAPSVAYGVQPSRIRRIYTDNSVYIIRCAIWRVSKIGRGLFSLVVKTPGCYNGIRGGPGFDSQYARISPAGSDVSLLLCIPPGDPGA